MASLYTPSPTLRYNLLRLPLLGRLLRWRWGRLALQMALLLVTAVALADGFTGPQAASHNVATVLTWVYYRAACPQICRASLSWSK